MDKEREDFLIQMLKDQASRFSGPHSVLNLGIWSAARYTYEGYVAPHGGTSEEWNWMEQHLRDHPEILDNPPVTDAELKRRREEATARAVELSDTAFGKFQAGDCAEALALIDEAEKLDPHARRWDAIRQKIQTRM